LIYSKRKAGALCNNFFFFLRLPFATYIMPNCEN
jgi:hypothetical protein